MKIKALIAALLVVACAAPGNAEDLSAFGLSNVQAVSDVDGAEIRGQGAISTSMASFQVFAFDYLSGSSINLQGSSMNLSDATGGVDTVGFEALSDAFAGIGPATISIDGFTVDTTGFELGSLGGGLANLFFDEPPHVEEVEVPEL
ncbi:hypothetical protein OAA27_02305 [bacterium]|nr:hypothetical protein [bacterium]